MRILYILIPFLIVYVFLFITYFNDCVKNSYFEGFEVTTADMKTTYENAQKYMTDVTKDQATLKDEIDRNRKMQVYKNGLNDVYNNITDPISDVYLPYYSVSNFDDISKMELDPQNKMNEFVIISIYKNLLDRQPNSTELNKLLHEFYEGNLDEDKLRMNIYNSTEYKMIVKMQSNDVDSGLISQVSSESLLDNLRTMYENELKREPKDEMMLPLKDCYIHLQYNDYLFRAMLVHRNFPAFENEVLDTAMLSREKMLELFNKYFLLTEIKVIANDFKRHDVLNRKARGSANALDNTNKASAKTETSLGTDKQIGEIVKDGNNVFNINISLNEDMLKSKAYSNDGKRKVGNGHGDIYDNVNNARCNVNDNICKVGDKYRVYNPITYKQQYRGDMRYRPNVCSYGTKQVVQPVFVESKTLFQGTDLKEAAENTSVGSIMPKFEYREYEEIDEKDFK